jgi:hypothetical protein
MSTKLGIVGAAAVLAIACGPAMAIDQSAVRQKTQALRHLGIQLQGTQRARAESSRHIQDGPQMPSRGQVPTPAYRQENCLNLSGNGGPVQVCWQVCISSEPAS